MVHHVLALFPEGAGQFLSIITAVVALAGAMLWLAGTHFSRSLVTLCTVAIGAGIGLQIPRWLGIPVGSWATSIAMALVLGFAGYGLHKTWVGGGLGAVMMFWFVAMAWIVWGPAHDELPARSPSADVTEHAAAVWTNLPRSFQWAGPTAAVLGLAGAVLVHLKFRKLTPMLMYSMLGVTMMAIFGLTAIELARPSLKAIVPTQWSGQLALLMGMAVFGAVVQWRWTVKPAGDTGRNEPRGGGPEGLPKH